MVLSYSKYFHRCCVRLYELFIFSDNLIIDSTFHVYTFSLVLDFIYPIVSVNLKSLPHMDCSTSVQDS